MQRTLLHSVLFSMLTCAFVACGNDQPKSTSEGASTSQSKPADSKGEPSKVAETKPTPAKSTDAHAPDAKSDSKDAAAPAAATKAGDTKPAAGDAAKPDGPPDPVAKMNEFIATLKIDKKSPSWRTKVPMPPKLTFDPKKTYYWLLDTTEGPIKIRLMPDIAPMHVSSTIYLTELGFYDTLKFHRVLTGFMAQGGDPLGTGGGGPAYHYDREISPNVKHSKAGILSMANTGQPGSEGSQFFLTFKAVPQLDGGYTVFGETVEGLDTLKKIESFGVPADPSPPTKLMTIRTAKIVVE